MMSMMLMLVFSCVPLLWLNCGKNTQQNSLKIDMSNYKLKTDRNSLPYMQEKRKFRGKIEFSLLNLFSLVVLSVRLLLYSYKRKKKKSLDISDTFNRLAEEWIFTFIIIIVSIVWQNEWGGRGRYVKRDCDVRRLVVVGIVVTWLPSPGYLLSKYYCKLTC